MRSINVVGRRPFAKIAESVQAISSPTAVPAEVSPNKPAILSKDNTRIKFGDRNYEWNNRRSVVPRPAGYTFGGGPGAVRDIVKEQAAAEMVEGGLLEMSHREKGAVHSMMQSLQQIIRDLLNVPQGYSILFMQGGAHAQFSAVPLNFGSHPKCVSCLTGSWSIKATNEQKKFANVIEYVPSAMTSTKQVLGEFAQELIKANADYGYLCSNETMQGLQFSEDLENLTSAPLVVDATSDLFSRKIDVSKYGVIFASGGKNLGPAGMAVVIVKDEIIHNRTASPTVPSFLHWKEYADSKPIQNLFNTPPLVSLGLSQLVLNDVVKRGGIEWAETKAKMLSSELYKEIDSSGGFYMNSVPRSLRSKVSVVFGIPGNKSLESKFVAKAESRGLLQLVNHPSVGGMRASLYNAVPVSAVEALLKFMDEFKREHDV